MSRGNHCTRGCGASEEGPRACLIAERHTSTEPMEGSGCGCNLAEVGACEDGKS